MHTSHHVKATSVLAGAAILGAVVVLVGTFAHAGDGLIDLTFSERCLAHLMMVALIVAVGLAIRPSSTTSPRL